MREPAQAKQAALSVLIRKNAPLVVAYSGGVDSAFLLATAVDAVGSHCLGVIADSPSLPRQALADALRLARQIGAQIEVIATEEMQNPAYTSNPINRCYFCKVELFQKLDGLAKGRSFQAIAYGENADDASQIRPGQKAAAEFRVLAPLKDVGLTKSEIRALSRALQLPTADLPAQPCLSSRIPHGTPVSVGALAMIEEAEAMMRDLGFRVFRVRHHRKKTGVGARVEVLPNELSRISEVKEILFAGLRRVGYDEVTIEPGGYRAPSA
ncbi:MAG: ATP-dependent sacrificial sulfur transferase LarE [Chthoniobacterales bacterium]